MALTQSEAVQDLRNTRFQILLVEDHPAVLAVLTALLSQSFPHWVICGVPTAEEAITLCECDPPDLVVMDISLPGMNGIEATARIKSLNPSTFVVMHSSSDAPIFRESAAKAGASAFVAKGRQSSTLIGTLVDLLWAG